jgi:very-short-patch-repair endonuclease
VSDLVVAELAARQLGIFARFQLLAADISRSFIDRQLRSARWRLRRPGVYELPGHRHSWAQELWVVYLAAGRNAAVSHEAAATSHEAPGFPEAVLTITVPHPGHQRVLGATVHQSRVLRPHHCVLVYGRRTTTMARTHIDLAGSTSRARLDAAYEFGLLTGRVSYAEMAATFTELYHPSRRGMLVLGDILDARGPGHVPAASELERRLFEVCERVGLRPLRQFPLPGRQAVTGCVDAALPDAKLILEADGRRWHSRVADFRRDRERDKAAARDGWQTMRFCHEELIENAAEEARTILDVYEQRCRLLARV